MDSYTQSTKSPPGVRGDIQHGLRGGDEAWVRGEEINGRAPDTYNRRRSPGPDHRRNSNRMRSRSPQNIDRYQPGRRDDYPNRRDDSYRRRTPPPGAQGGMDRGIDRYIPGQNPPPALVNVLIDPMKMDQQVGFSYFAEWWRNEQRVKEEREAQKSGGRRPPVKGEKESREEREDERKQTQAAYDAYKGQLQAQQARIFVQLHKDEEWFKERYDPDVRELFRRRQAEFRRGAYAQWVYDLDSGNLDECTLEGFYKSESNGAGGIAEREEGETIAATEVLGVSDLLPCKGGDLRDEATDAPALLIKTIAPGVSRERLEAFCREHLGESEGGFKWLSLSDPNPLKKFHRIGWVMLNPGGDEVTTVIKDDRGDGRDEEKEEGDEKMDTSDPTSVTQTGTEKALAEINGKAISVQDKNDFICHVGLHVPSTITRKKALWDLFSAPERVEKDFQLAMRLVSKLEQELGEDASGTNKVEERVEDIRSRGLLQPQSNGSVKLPRVLGEVVKTESEEGEDAEIDDEEEGAWDEESDDEDLLAKKKKLDLLVDYLRRVFSFCFYCVFESDSVHELTRKCPGGHLRRPRAALTSSAKAAAKASAYGEPFPLKRQESGGEDGNEEGDSPVAEKRFNRNNKTHQQLQRAFNWVKTYEDKLNQICEPENVDLKKLGGRPLDEAVEEEMKKFVKQEDESKYRCKVPGCTKLFRGESFWRSHVEKRHVDWFKIFKKDLNLINSYVLDPAHIIPSRTDASSNGHFPMGNGNMPNGTPRGFNLNNMSMPPFGIPAPGMNPMVGFPATFGHYPVTMPHPLATGYGANFSMDGSQAGPMRRGPGRFAGSNRTNGPYDRQPKDARNMKWGVDGGATMRGVQPQRFADAGGVGAVAPREAVQGRSLKSYEDLDATTGAEGGGELNY